MTTHVSIASHAARRARRSDLNHSRPRTVTGDGSAPLINVAVPMRSYADLLAPILLHAAPPAVMALKIAPPRCQPRSNSSQFAGTFGAHGVWLHATRRGRMLLMERFPGRTAASIRVGVEIYETRSRLIRCNWTEVA
jgi:hypothetical protein